MNPFLPYVNRELFSQHFLDARLAALPAWAEARAASGAALAKLRALYATEEKQLPKYNEEQLRHHWLDPVLAELGACRTPTFLDWLRLTMGLPKTMQRLESFWRLSDQGLATELKRAGLKLSAAESEVRGEFEKSKAQVLALGPRSAPWSTKRSGSSTTPQAARNNKECTYRGERV